MRIAVVEDEQPLALALQKGLRAESCDVDLFFDAASARGGGFLRKGISMIWWY